VRVLLATIEIVHVMVHFGCTRKNCACSVPGSVFFSGGIPRKWQIKMQFGSNYE
jgi:hypothetical protein